MGSVVRPTRKHIEHVACHMRQSDRDEVMASVGMYPLPALMMSVTDSNRTYAMLTDDGTPFVLFGVAPLAGHPGVGVPWLLATDDVVNNRIFCLKTSLRYVKEFLEDYEILLNFVDVRNRLSIEWIKWCGFQIADYRHEFGVGKLPFLQFSMMRP